MIINIRFIKYAGSCSVSHSLIYHSLFIINIHITKEHKVVTGKIIHKEKEIKLHIQDTFDKVFSTVLHFPHHTLPVVDRVLNLST